MRIADSRAVTHDTLWDIVSREGKRVVLIGVPQTYPPKPTNGYIITSFLTPSTQSQYTYPNALKHEIEPLVDGEYMLDVPDFRTDDKVGLVQQIYRMTKNRLAVVKYMLRETPWDLFTYVEMGPDRIHHGFWKHMDPRHPKHDPDSPFANAIGKYYEYLDGAVGEILQLVPQDTVVLVASDHGAQPMMGGIRFNEWLRQQGYLVLKERPPADRIVPLEKVEIDWSKTTAWGAGGYFGRLFLNVQGREPQGVVPPDQYERVRDELAEKLVAMAGPDGAPLGTVVIRPQDVYQEIRNVPPDLIVYFGNLAWRSLGTLGPTSIYASENDTGPDDANHAQHGMFILHDPHRDSSNQADGVQLMDVTPTVLDTMGITPPADMRGRIISA